MLEFDPEAVRRNVRNATTEDLLDRVTAFRTGMEPEALPIIEDELFRRGVGPSGIRHHELENCVDIVYRPEGFAYKCSFCRRPAVLRRRGWHRLWGLVPILPTIVSYCSRHAEAVDQLEPAEENE